MSAWPWSCLAIALASCTPRASPSPSSERPDATFDAAALPADPAPPSTKTIAIAPSRPPVRDLVVFLHGVGADADSFASVARAFGVELPRAELLVPDGFYPWDGGPEGRQWFSLRAITEDNVDARARDAGHEVSRWIDAELRRRGLSGDRLVVVGFSQGAMLAAWLAIHRAPRPAAAIVLSGRVADARPAITGGPTRVLLAHGDHDARIPAAVVEPGARQLEASGAQVTTRIYPGLGHQIDPLELREAAVFAAQALAARE